MESKVIEAMQKFPKFQVTKICEMELEKNKKVSLLF